MCTCGRPPNILFSSIKSFTTVLANMIYGFCKLYWRIITINLLFYCNQYREMNNLSQWRKHKNCRHHSAFVSSRRGVSENFGGKNESHIKAILARTLLWLAFIEVECCVYSCQQNLLVRWKLYLLLQMNINVHSFRRANCLYMWLWCC